MISSVAINSKKLFRTVGLISVPIPGLCKQFHVESLAAKYHKSPLKLRNFCEATYGILKNSSRPKEVL